MALLIVPRETWAQSPQPASTSSSTASTSAQGGFGQLKELVDPSLRKKVAKDVNEAILASQGQKREANIRHLVRTRAWAEKLARDKKVDLPPELKLGLDSDETPENGHSNDTEMSGSAVVPSTDGAGSTRRSRATSGIADAVMTGGSGGPQRE